MLRDVQISEHLSIKKTKNQSNSIMCNDLLNYLVSVLVSTKMHVLVLCLFCKNTGVSVHPHKSFPLGIQTWR